MPRGSLRTRPSNLPKPSQGGRAGFKTNTTFNGSCHPTRKKRFPFRSSLRKSASPSSESSMVSVEEIRKAQRADGPATVLAIGTATPPHSVLQADYPDYYFRITKSEHMTDLKEKFRRMCT